MPFRRCQHHAPALGDGSAGAAHSPVDVGLSESVLMEPDVRIPLALARAARAQAARRKRRGRTRPGPNESASACSAHALRRLEGLKHWCLRTLDADVMVITDDHARCQALLRRELRRIGNMLGFNAPSISRLELTRMGVGWNGIHGEHTGAEAMIGLARDVAWLARVACCRPVRRPSNRGTLAGSARCDRVSVEVVFS
jgi:hypothetical protein